MRDNIYISTTVFRNKDLKNILETCLKHGFTNIELGSNVNYSNAYHDLLLKFSNTPMRFLLHGYFPRPKDDFVLNLASNNEEILQKSIQHCKHTIDLSAKLKAPFYSIHAGYAFNASPDDLGHPLLKLPRIPYQQAYKTLQTSMSELCEYAQKVKVRLAIENNVVTNFNLEDGKNTVLLIADELEAVKFNELVCSPNLFYLIDLGHLKITSTSLGFDISHYLKKILPFTLAFHLSDNNSMEDQHLSFNKEAWFKDIVRRNKDKFFILEAQNLETKQIRECYEDLVTMLG